MIAPQTRLVGALPLCYKAGLNHREMLILAVFENVFSSAFPRFEGISQMKLASCHDDCASWGELYVRAILSVKGMGAASQRLCHRCRKQIHSTMMLARVACTCPMQHNRAQWPGGAACLILMSSYNMLVLASLELPSLHASHAFQETSCLPSTASFSYFPMCLVESLYMLRFTPSLALSTSVILACRS